jgi:hypothetical protein
LGARLLELFPDGEGKELGGHLRAVLGGASRAAKLAAADDPGAEWTVEVAPLRGPGDDAVIGGILVAEAAQGP